MDGFMTDTNEPKIRGYMQRMLDVMLNDPEIRDRIQAGVRLDLLLGGNQNFQIDEKLLTPLLNKDTQNDSEQKYDFKRAFERLVAGEEQNPKLSQGGQLTEERFDQLQAMIEKADKTFPGKQELLQDLRDIRSGKVAAEHKKSFGFDPAKPGGLVPPIRGVVGGTGEQLIQDIMGGNEIPPGSQEFKMFRPGGAFVPKPGEDRRSMKPFNITPPILDTPPQPLPKNDAPVSSIAKPHPLPMA